MKAVEAGDDSPESVAEALLEQVHDRQSFFAFVAALIKDRQSSVERERVAPNPLPYYCPDAGGWYNATIEDYLTAALSWAIHTDMGVTQDLPEEPSWQAFATFLYLGKIYE
jgi:hypothetical protein